MTSTNLFCTVLGACLFKLFQVESTKGKKQIGSGTFEIYELYAKFPIIFQFAIRYVISYACNLHRSLIGLYRIESQQTQWWNNYGVRYNSCDLKYRKFRVRISSGSCLRAIFMAVWLWAHIIQFIRQQMAKWFSWAAKIRLNGHYLSKEVRATISSGYICFCRLFLFVCSWFVLSINCNCCLSPK